MINTQEKAWSFNPRVCHVSVLCSVEIYQVVGGPFDFIKILAMVSWKCVLSKSPLCTKSIG